MTQLEYDNELCEECTAFCKFKVFVDREKSKLPRKPSLEEAMKYQNDVAVQRISAREKRCPNVNYDPNFPGRNLL